jgi:hypothetical protein
LSSCDVGIDPCEQEGGPTFDEFVPEGARFAPRLRIDGFRIGEVFFEDGLGFGDDGWEGDTEEEFVINAEATDVEVGGSDVNGVIDLDEFGVKDLRLIFVEGDAGFEEALVETPTRRLHEDDV